MPLSLCSFSPSGDGVWFGLVVQLLAPCLFCLQLFHLKVKGDINEEMGMDGVRDTLSVIFHKKPSKI